MRTTRDIISMGGAFVLLILLMTAAGYAVVSFVEWTWPWNFEDHQMGRLWFFFCTFLVIGATAQGAHEEAQKEKGGSSDQDDL